MLLWQLNKREKSLHILRGFHIMSVAAAPPLSPLRGVGGRMGKSTAVGGSLCSANTFAHYICSQGVFLNEA